MTRSLHYFTLPCIYIACLFMSLFLFTYVFINICIPHSCQLDFFILFYILMCHSTFLTLFVVCCHKYTLLFMYYFSKGCTTYHCQLARHLLISLN